MERKDTAGGRERSHAGVSNALTPKKANLLVQVYSNTSHSLVVRLLEASSPIESRSSGARSRCTNTRDAAHELQTPSVETEGT